jgi:pSer/pThr/pTyr-binding forkhead associated (FHA) protein
MSHPLVTGRAGQFAGVSTPVPAAGLLLGREAAGAGALVFAEDTEVSRRHCRIEYVNAQRRFRVTDLGSRNGSFSMPDGKRLPAQQPQLFRPGQLIRLGEREVFELSLA